MALFICLIVGGDLHHSGGSGGGGQALDITAAVLPGGGKHLGASFAAKEDHPLVKHGQTGDLHRPGSPHKGVGGDAVEVPHIHGVESPVEGDRLHIDVRVQQLGAAGFYRHCPVDDLLAAPGGVDPQILDTVLIGRYSALYTKILLRKPLTVLIVRGFLMLHNIFSIGHSIAQLALYFQNINIWP